MPFLEFYWKFWDITMSERKKRMKHSKSEKQTLSELNELQIQRKANKTIQNNGHLIFLIGSLIYSFVSARFVLSLCLGLCESIIKIWSIILIKFIYIDRIIVNGMIVGLPHAKLQKFTYTNPAWKQNAFTFVVKIKINAIK